MPEDNTAEAHAEAQRAEYGKWVAKEAIYDGTALAFNPGDAVPVSHVERGVVSKDQVEAVKTAAKTKES